jgi:alpha-L-fucosidase
VVINNRVGKRSVLGANLGILGKSFSGDYDTPENTIPKKLPPREWETCMTFNDSWGYKADDHNWKPAGELIGMLVECVSLNGNFLLNVGPSPEGVIPEESVTRLKEIGQWMGRNGEAIYGCGPGPVRADKLRSTKKGNTVYLLLFDWPSQLTVKMTERVKRAYLLSDPAHPELKFRQTGNALSFALPSPRPEQSVSVVALES